MKKLFKILQVYALFASVVSAKKWNVKDNAAQYEGDQIFKIKKSAFVEDLLKTTKVDIWNGNSTFYDVLVKKNKVHFIEKLLNVNDILYTVVSPNIAETIRRENAHQNITSMRSSRGTPEFTKYLTLEETYDYLDYLAKKYPETVSVSTFGYTEQQRPLMCISIFSGKENADVVFIDGGIHAREWIAIASVTYIIKELVENRKNLGPYVLKHDFIIVPIVNPDGYDYTHTIDRLWRKNRSKMGDCFGTDINRNFDFHFGGEGTSNDPCSQIYHGRGPNSELESTALSNLLTSLKGSLKAYITFHSYGQYILIPFGYEKDAFAPDFTDLYKVAKQAAKAMQKIEGKIYEYGNTANMLYPAAGGSDDWAKAYTGAKYVYTIELRDEGDYGFVLPPKYIIPTGMEAFAAIRVIAKAVTTKS